MVITDKMVGSGQGRVVYSSWIHGNKLRQPTLGFLLPFCLPIGRRLTSRYLTTDILFSHHQGPIWSQGDRYPVFLLSRGPSDLRAIMLAWEQLDLVWTIATMGIPRGRWAGVFQKLAIIPRLYKSVDWRFYPTWSLYGSHTCSRLVPNKHTEVHINYKTDWPSISIFLLTLITYISP